MFLPDFPPFIESHTVLEHLVLLLRAYGRDDAVDDARIIALLHDLDLLPHAESAVAELSRGQRYKTALAALLLIRPEVWLLDEPFASGMDPQGMHLLKQHARQAANDGACVVYTTQILEIAERFCDDLLVIDHGRVAQRFVQDELRTFPSEGPGSLGDRLSRFREKR
jgi:ABC-type multidrug transport system ATPase subunit